KQEFLTELESILESNEAYGSNIQVLTYAVKNEVINGKFKDSWNNRVYEFVIDVDGISYKPAVKLDSFSTDEVPARFDAFSEGYASLFEEVRLDRTPIGKRVKKPKCGNEGYGCGFSCIGLAKTCRILSSGQKTKGNFQERAIGKERLRKLLVLGDKILALGKGGALIRASDIKSQIERERSRKAGQLVETRKEKLAQRQPPAKEKQPAKPKSDLTANPKGLVVDQEIFKTKFPSKEVQREYGLGGVIDRAKSAIDLVENPKTFSKMPASEQAGVLDNLTTIHGVGDKNWDERLKVPAVANSEERRIGAEAANIRAQGAKQIWDNLDAKEKLTLAKNLKEVGSSLANEDDQFENKYVNQLASEIRDLNNKKNSDSSKQPIKSYNDFKDESLAIYDKLNKSNNLGDLVPIHKVRKELEGKVGKAQFDEWLLDMQDKDIIQLMAGDTRAMTPKEREESLSMPGGSGRHLIKKL
ncbi:MAG TPA: hypothetical protein VK211_13635, partial [Kamptonema sp.]|nr:hypothetical protein [Kamptonema sp.]